MVGCRHGQQLTTVADGCAVVGWTQVHGRISPDLPVVMPHVAGNWSAILLPTLSGHSDDTLTLGEGPLRSTRLPGVRHAWMLPPLPASHKAGIPR